MTTAVEPARVRSGALDQKTVCAAFQATVAHVPDRIALRTRGDETTVTWAQYAERVRRTAAGLAGLGIGRGSTVALMLTNRPEFHIVDAAAMHLGATPFSIYNTAAPDQIAHLFANAGNRVVIAEQKYLLKFGGNVQHGAAGIAQVDYLFDDKARRSRIEAPSRLQSE